MGTWLLYVAGAALMTLMALQCAGQRSNIRAKLEAESRDRFNFFDIELLKSMASSREGNLLLSPACVKATLAMVLEGARGNSAKQLKEALRLPDDDNDVRKHFSNFINSLRVNNPPNVVEAASQIFLANNIALNPQYQTALKKNYNAETERVDFTTPVNAARAINRWVNIFTRGYIPTLVDPGKIASNTKLLLANAMYFKGRWKNAFEGDKTSAKCFYLQPEQCFYADFMETSNIYNYAYVGSLHAHAVELPYEGEQFSLLLLLPIKRNAVNQLTRDLSHATLHNIVSSLEGTDVLLSLPRFNIDFNIDLIHTLSALEIQDIFSPKANLTGMLQWVNSDLHITNFLHKTKIEVNEDGTVAAAASGALVVPLMGTSVTKLIFNHPFLFFLRNTQTGDILFSGRVSQPAAATQPVLGSINESELQGIFTSPAVAGGAGWPVDSTLNPQSPNTNVYDPSSLGGSQLSTNKNSPVPQSQLPATNYPATHSNQKPTINEPSSTPFQSYQPPRQVQSISNARPQPNVVQYPSSSNRVVTIHASNPDMIGQNVRAIPQPNTVQYQMRISRGVTIHTSNPDTISQNVRNPGQISSIRGSYVSPIQNGPGKSNRIYNDEFQFTT